MDHAAIKSALSANAVPAGPLDIATPDVALRLIVIGGLDPNDDDTWSGTPKALIAALRADGHSVSTVGPLPKLETGWPRLKAWAHRRFGGKTYLAVRDLNALQRRTAPLTAALRALEPYDAVIAWHAADAAVARTTAPLIFVHDATWRLLLDFYPRYQRRHLTRSSVLAGEALDRAALANCDYAIYSSHWAADAAREDYGAPAGKLIVHPFGANLPRIPTADELRRAIAERNQDPCRLIFAGVDWVRKGGDIAIAIAQQLNDRGIACELDVIGMEPSADHKPWLRAHGFLSRKDPQATERRAALFARADFLVLPSRADCTPIVLNEAAAYGLPTVTTAVGGIPEIVGDTGWAKAFPVGTPVEVFANWIERAYCDRAQYERLAWLGRHEYDRRLNWASFARTLTATISEHQSGAAPLRVKAEINT